jgi:hypothetical protein
MMMYIFLYNGQTVTGSQVGIDYDLQARINIVCGLERLFRHLCLMGTIRLHHGRVPSFHRFFWSTDQQPRAHYLATDFWTTRVERSSWQLPDLHWFHQLRRNLCLRSVQTIRWITAEANLSFNLFDHRQQNHLGTD